MSFSSLHGEDIKPRTKMIIKSLKVPIDEIFESLPIEGAYDFLVKNRLRFISEIGGILMDWNISKVSFLKCCNLKMAICIFYSLS